MRCFRNQAGIVGESSENRRFTFGLEIFGYQLVLHIVGIVGKSYIRYIYLSIYLREREGESGNTFTPADTDDTDDIIQAFDCERLVNQNSTADMRTILPIRKKYNFLTY